MQKKILLAVAVFLIITNVDAQIKKGAILLGGGFNFTSQNTTTTNIADSKTNSFTFSPAFGKAVKENLVIGADISFGYSKTNSANVEIAKLHSYGMGVFARRYKELGKGFYLFGQARAGWSYADQNDYDQSPAKNEVKANAVQLALYPGISYAVTKNLQIETGLSNLASIQYSHSKATGANQAESVSNGFSLASSLSSFSGFTLEFRFLLN